MDLSLFLHKTDIQLYKSILNKINKDFDSIEPSVLGDLLDKLKDIHSSLENVVRQRSIQQMYDTPKNKRMNLIRLKIDREELEKIRDRKEWFKECIKTDSMLLSDIYTEIKNKRKMRS
jgi:hypothetical protein